MQTSYLELTNILSTIVTYHIWCQYLRGCVREYQGYMKLCVPVPRLHELCLQGMGLSKGCCIWLIKWEQIVHCNYTRVILCS